MDLSSIFPKTKIIVQSKESWTKTMFDKIYIRTKLSFIDFRKDGDGH